MAWMLQISHMSQQQECGRTRKPCMCDVEAHAYVEDLQTLNEKDNLVIIWHIVSFFLVAHTRPRPG